MSVRTLIIRSVAVLLLCAPGVGWAANALIVHDGTAGIEADALANLTGKLTAAGFTVSANVGLPGSLAGNQQVWDIRFNNTTPLTGSDITAYVAYMAAGGSLFVMGENVGFNTRNNTIVTLVTAAGGGTIAMMTPANTEIVNPPFTGPNAVTTITFLAPAGSATPGTGSFATNDGGGGAAIVWAPGTMANAGLGSLIVVFDVNFLQAGADANSQAFSNNLIAYLAAPSQVGARPVPALSTWAMLALGVALAAAAVRFLGGHRAV